MNDLQIEGWDTIGDENYVRAKYPHIRIIRPRDRDSGTYTITRDPCEKPQTIAAANLYIVWHVLRTQIDAETDHD